MNLVVRITGRAARQHGVISLGQLDELAVTRWARRQFVDSGWLVPVAPRVWAVAGAPSSWERSLWIAILALGPQALVSHRAAAALHGFDRSTRKYVDVTLPRVRRGSGLGALTPWTVHTTGILQAIDRVRVGGLPVTSATRTVIDLARLRVPVVVLEASIDTAVRVGLSSPVVIEQRLRELRGSGRWGCRTLDRLLVDSGGHTRLERKFLRLMRESGLPRPRTQVVHRAGSRTVARVDFLFDPYDLVVEVSGRHGHSSPAERARDAQRRNELQAIGRTVYEYTWEDVTERSVVVRNGVREFLSRAGWTPDSGVYVASLADRSARNAT